MSIILADGDRVLDERAEKFFVFLWRLVVFFTASVLSICALVRIFDVERRVNIDEVYALVSDQCFDDALVGTVADIQPMIAERVQLADFHCRLFYFLDLNFVVPVVVFDFQVVVPHLGEGVGIDDIENYVHAEFAKEVVIERSAHGIANDEVTFAFQLGERTRWHAHVDFVIFFSKRNECLLATMTCKQDIIRVDDRYLGQPEVRDAFDEFLFRPVTLHLRISLELFEIADATLFGAPFQFWFLIGHIYKMQH